jgi:hypothetical protein
MSPIEQVHKPGCKIHPEPRGFTWGSDSIHHACGCAVLRGETVLTQKQIDRLPKCESCGEPFTRSWSDTGTLCIECDDFNKEIL